MEHTEIKRVLEAALLAAGRPLTADKLRELFAAKGGIEKAALNEALAQLAADYDGRGIELKEVASGYRIQIRSAMSDWLMPLWEERSPRYTRALLETLALVAYRQPITRGEIEEVRGVAVSTNIMRTLLERGWIRVVGHRDVPGKPAMFGTTKEFLDYFGLKKLDDLPPLAELKDWSPEESPQTDLAFDPAQAPAQAHAGLPEDEEAQADSELAEPAMQGGGLEDGDGKLAAASGPDGADGEEAAPEQAARASATDEQDGGQAESAATDEQASGQGESAAADEQGTAQDERAGADEQGSAREESAGADEQVIAQEESAGADEQVIARDESAGADAMGTAQDERTSAGEQDSADEVAAADEGTAAETDEAAAADESAIGNEAARAEALAPSDEAPEATADDEPASSALATGEAATFTGQAEHADDGREGDADADDGNDDAVEEPWSARVVRLPRSEPQ